MDRQHFEILKKVPLYKGKIVSNSMEPVIRVGEEVVVDVGAKDIQRFDIIVIYVEGKLICHYVWQVNRLVMPKLIQTRNMGGKLDFPVSEADYLGKVLNFKLNWWHKLRIFF